MSARLRNPIVVLITFLAAANIIAVATAAAPRPTLSFTETLREASVCQTVGDNLQCTLRPSDGLSVIGKIPLPPGAGTNIGPATLFTMTLGDLAISRVLAEDTNYRVGKHTATFIDKYTNSLGRVVKYRTVRLSWTPKQLVVSVIGRISDTSISGWNSVRASRYADLSSGRINNTLSGTIRLGEYRYGFNSVTSRATIATRRLIARDHTQLFPSVVTVKGSGTGTATPFVPATVVMGGDTIVTNFLAANAGGTVTISSGPLSNVVVTFPPGAVSSDANVTVSFNSSVVLPRSGSFPGRAFTITTDGQTTFQEPVRITIPFDDDGSLIPVPYYVAPGGTLEPCQIISVDHTAHTLTFETYHASVFTWLYALLFGGNPHTSYLPATDGFQIVNYGSVYNPGGECFGISAFEKWYFDTKGGGLYSRYMQDIPANGGTVKGQNIIATRAHTAVSRLWTTYYPRVQPQFNLTAAERYATIVNVIDNTAAPTILYLGPTHFHAVLAYDYNASSLLINDPNHPGTVRTAQYNSGNSTLTYDTWTDITVIGDGSLRKESFENIYQDAESGFSGSGLAQVNVTSHTSGQHVTDRTVIVEGEIESGQVLVDRLEIWLNGVTKFEAAIHEDGLFSVAVNLVAGENKITFATKGHDIRNNAIDAPNTQRAPFILNADTDNSVILVTLTWDTDDTDLDLYTIDPTGDFSSYFHDTTADGGELDYDNTSGYGPEHWTLNAGDTVRTNQDYSIRLHYYSGHAGYPPPATRWTITVLLYEGTPDAVLYTFGGVLGYDGPANHQPTNTGADWADVCVIRPFPAGAAAAPSVEKRAFMPARINVPMPSLQDRQLIKWANTTKTR